MFKVNESHRDYANADWPQSVFTFVLIAGILFSYIQARNISVVARYVLAIREAFGDFRIT